MLLIRFKELMPCLIIYTKLRVTQIKADLTAKLSTYKRNRSAPLVETEFCKPSLLGQLRPQTELGNEGVNDYLQTCTLAYLHTCTLAYLHTCILAYLHTCTLANLILEKNRMKQTKLHFTLILALMALIIAGCAFGPATSGPDWPARESHNSASNNSSPTITNTPQPTTRPTHTPPTLRPPVVSQTIPQQDRSHPFNAPLEISFDQPMDQDSVEQAFTIQPGSAAAGIFNWVDSQSVQFG